ncbi:HD domain-containing phosphohydrolase [Candidatus Laterigemmans baculatus]|uniref:HD domain-containing phosphohydrolase n=1 Tax=Candidatus Laterigemmans baculatus TaxID=2770505 RepID=UPI0013DD217E|nr:HD domain-containing phosphohydrolase [Candidatus Laterigemmans baculatus]
MNILLVDDDPTNLAVLENSVRCFGFEPTTVENGRDALRLIRTGSFQMVISDIEMPGMSGIELCREIRGRATNGYVYIILLTSYCDTESVIKGLDAGADDYMSKPFHPAELQMRLRAGKRLLSLEGRDLVIFTMAKLADHRDNETGAHLERMRLYTQLLASELSNWPQYRNTVDGQYVRLIYMTSPLHDIGKVGIPDRILLKPGPLTPEEFEIMKTHTIIGAETLESAAQHYPEADFLRMAYEIALTHHERWDGSGYPNGLAGEQIPLCGRITALADVYDALTSRRVYKPAFSHEKARRIILDGAGSHFDPAIVQAFLNVEREFIQIQHRAATDCVEQSLFQVPSFRSSLNLPMTV